MTAREGGGSAPKRRGRPPKTPEQHDRQLIGLAKNLAEKQLREGTATAQVVVHYLKLDSERDRLEVEKLARENAVLRAKEEAYQSAKNVEELYAKALGAMRSYSGQDEEPVEDEYEG